MESQEEGGLQAGSMAVGMSSRKELSEPAWAVMNATGWAASVQTFTSHSSGAWEVQDQGQETAFLVRTLLLACTKPSFELRLHMVERE